MSQACFPEVVLLKHVYRSSPSLQQPKSPAGPTENGADGSRGYLAVAKGLLRQAAAGWRLYVRQPVFTAALSLALLYFTVFSFGFLMVGFLIWSGESEVRISIFRGLGALCGLAATAVFPWLHAKLGLHRAGTWGVCYQLGWLLLSAAPILLHARYDRPAATPHGLLLLLLATGVAASRTGLWILDLSVTQQIQEGVAVQDLGTVNGVQSSMNSFCEILVFAIGLAMPRPQDFRWLMLMSLAASALAAALYCFGARKGNAAAAQPARYWEPGGEGDTASETSVLIPAVELQSIGLPAGQKATPVQ